MPSHGKGSPAVILLDLKLPGKNSFQFLEWLREHSEFNNILTVVISGLGDLASIRRAYALGADSFLWAA
jgi:DNA-binding NarL/FixJ family response regulator